jgi:3-oxoacyl-[acyl-carrier-protein] synthase III
LDYFGPDANAPAANDLAAENGLMADDVDQVLFTQISKRKIAIAAERCGVPPERCHTMEKYGYTDSACIRWGWTMPLNSAKSNGVTLLS